MHLDEVTGHIVDAAYKVHTGLGCGLLESVYETVLARDLERRGLSVDRQKYLSFDYDGLHFVDCLRVDLLVEAVVIVEIKSAEKLVPQHAKQLLTYLRVTGLKVGFLMNFDEIRLQNGLRRVVNGLAPSASPHLRVNQLSAAVTRDVSRSDGRETTDQ